MSELKIEAGAHAMTTYIRIEPQPRPCQGCIDDGHGGLWQPNKTVLRWAMCLDQSLRAIWPPHPPGSLLDGKRVVSVGVVERDGVWFWQVEVEG